MIVSDNQFISELFTITVALAKFFGKNKENAERTQNWEPEKRTKCANMQRRQCQ